MLNFKKFSCLALLFALALAQAQAQTVTVSNTVAADYTKLKDALAANPDVINILDSGTYAEAITFANAKPLTIQAATGQTPTITKRWDLAGQALTLTGLKFESAAGDWLTTIYSGGTSGNLTMNNCTIISWMCMMLQSNAVTTFNNCTITGYEFPIVILGGNTVFNQSTISGNCGFTNAWGAPAGVTLTFDRCVLKTTYSQWVGQPGLLKMTNCLFEYQKPFTFTEAGQGNMKVQKGIALESGASLSLIHTTILNGNDADEATTPSAAIHITNGAAPGPMAITIENCYFDLSSVGGTAITSTATNVTLTGKVNAYHAPTLPTAFESQERIAVDLVACPGHIYDETGHVILAQGVQANNWITNRGAALTPSVDVDIDNKVRPNGGTRPDLGCDEVPSTVPVELSSFDAN